MCRECRERFPSYRGLAITVCITARAWRTCRDVYRDLLLAVSFEVGGGENAHGIPGTCTPSNFTYLVRGSLEQSIDPGPIFPREGTKFKQTFIRILTSLVVDISWLDMDAWLLSTEKYAVLLAAHAVIPECVCTIRFLSVLVIL